MKKIFWMIVLVAAYIWVVTTGREQYVLDQSKRVYQAVVQWFDDADVDLQIPKNSTPIKKKHHRRWD